MGHLVQASAWLNLIAERLLPFYSAVENGWKEEAPACARRLVQEHNARDLAMLYHPKMETVGSLPYRRLLAYAQACRDAHPRTSSTALFCVVLLPHTLPRDTVHRLAAGVAHGPFRGRTGRAQGPPSPVAASAGSPSEVVVRDFLRGIGYRRSATLYSAAREQIQG